MEQVDFDDFYSGHGPSFGEDITPGLDLVFELLPDRATVLEVGCGDGRDSFHLAQKFARVDCFDASAVAIAKLRARAVHDGLEKRINACQKMVQDVDPKAENYDLFVAVTLFDHLPSPASEEELQRFIDAAKLGSYLFIMVHTVDDPGASNNTTKSELSGAIKTYFDENSLLGISKKAGRIVFYKEMKELDLDHGDPHHHGFATCLFQKM